MTDQEKPVGLVIKEIAAEKHLPVRTLSARIGKGRQFVYDNFNKKRMPHDYIEMWAKALEVTTDEIYARHGVAGPNSAARRVAYDIYTYVEELEQRVREQAENNRVLSETVRVLLGKSEVCPAYAGL